MPLSIDFFFTPTILKIATSTTTPLVLVAMSALLAGALGVQCGKVSRCFCTARLLKRASWRERVIAEAEEKAT